MRKKQILSIFTDSKEELAAVIAVLALKILELSRKCPTEIVDCRFGDKDSNPCQITVYINVNFTVLLNNFLSS